jgi:SulP family sulfate permease
VSGSDSMISADSPRPFLQSFRILMGDFFGAFADSAILLPLLMLLGRIPGFSLPVLIGTAGVTYVLAGRFFRVPMPVQPLKAVAIASVSVGAGAYEIRVASFFLGAFFLGLFLLRKKNLPIPEPVVRAVQTGLGVLLLLQAKKVLPVDPSLALPSYLLFGIILLLQYSFQVSSLGFFALLLFVGSLTKEHLPPGSLVTDFAPHFSGDWHLSLSMVASLLLPQLALTSANSITGARIAIAHYFNPKSDRVTIPRLMFFVGLGNMIAALIPGLPFCHGAGGVTAHAKGGASTERMNWIIGGALLLVSILIYFYDLTVRVDSFALSAILACVGVFHLELARPLLKDPLGRVLLVLSVLITLIRSDLLLVLIAAFLVHALGNKFWKRVPRG